MLVAKMPMKIVVTIAALDQITIVLEIIVKMPIMGFMAIVPIEMKIVATVILETVIADLVAVIVIADLVVADTEVDLMVDGADVVRHVREC